MFFTFRAPALRAFALGISAFLLLSVLTFVAPGLPVTPAFASTPTATCSAPGTTAGGVAQSGVEVYPSHGRVFYIDSGQGQSVDAAYAGYQVKNVSGSAKANLWAQVDTFTGGVVRLVNPRDAYFRIGAVANNALAPAYFLMSAGVSTTRAQSHVVRIFQDDPRLGGTELYTCTYSFVSVKETIKAAANKVEGVTPDYSASQIGGEVVIRVKGRTGTIGSGTSSPDGEVLWFSPAARSSWPSSSLVLTSTRIDFASNGYPSGGSSQNASSHTNRLVFLKPTNSIASGGLVANGNPKSFYYEATYRFRIAGPVPSSIQAIPIAQISSGTQIKHTDVKSVTDQAGSTLTVTAPVNVDVAKTANPEVVVNGSDREIRYTVTLSNSSSTAVDLDRLVDERGAGLSLKAGSSLINGAAVTPVADGSNLVFPGPISVPASSGGSAGTTTVTYTMVSACTEGEVSFTNLAFGVIGDLVVGKSGSTVAGVTVSGTCPSVTSSLTVAAADRAIDPAALTQPASAVGLTSATLNGSVDPNGVAGLPITFVFGTHPTLAGATTVSLTDSTNSADFYSVTRGITGLTSGTVYYFRVTIGDSRGDILSFVTAEEVGTPTVVTNQVTDIAQITSTNWRATFNATLDPNQVPTIPSFTFGLTGGSGAEESCTNAVYSTTQTVREDTTDNGSFDTDVTLTGAFPVEVSWEVQNLARDKFYCVKARGTRTDTNTVIEASPVLFRTAAVSAQTINGFSAPALDTVGTTATLTASPTSGLTPVFSSNTPDVCTVSGNVVTIVGGGICSLSADQPGNTSFYAAPTVTVTFSIAAFTLTYNLNGGSGSAPVDGASPYGNGGTVTVTQAVPSRSGNSFTGWNTAPDGQGTPRASSDTFVIAANVVLYAQWTVATTFTISYSANGGTNAPPASEHPQNTTVALTSAVPSRSGFRFDGWTENSNGTGTKFGSSSNFSLGGANVTLNARWVEVVGLNYSANGADSGQTPASTESDVGAVVALTAGNPGGLVRSGFTFDGWATTQNNGNAVANVTVAAPTTVYARWIATVTYNDNGATVGRTASDTTQYQPGSTVTLLAGGVSPSRSRFDFAGWNTAPDGSGTRRAPGSTFVMAGNQTLYAEWTSAITYDANSADSGSAPTDGTVYRPADVVTVRPNSGNLARTGFVFDGWNTESNGQGTGAASGSTLTGPGNTTLFARWLVEITVTFSGNSNSGGTPPAPQSLGQGQSFTAPPNGGSLTRSGHTFEGWSLQPSGGATIIPGVGIITPSSAITVYAKWAEITAVVTQGGSGPIPPAVVNPPNLAPGLGPTPPRRVTPPGRVLPLGPTQPLVVTPPVAPPIAPLVSAEPLTPALPGFGPRSQPQGGGGGNPGSLFGGQATIDFGGTPAPAGTGANSAPTGNGSPAPASDSAGRRTVQEMAQENLRGFAPGVGTFIEILGTRTAARFVVSETSTVDQFTLIRAIEASVPSQAADFFAIDSVQPVNAPLVTPSWSPEQRAGITDFFAGAGLGAPTNLSDLNLSDYSQWLLVSARSQTYAPGTQVYLTLTSEPLVIGSAVVAADGTATLSGTIPVEFLSAGEHRVRLVGIRSLDGVSVDDDGAVQVSPELLAEIQRFDLGTQATVAVMGENPQGANHVALRVIPLIPIAPWWTLWILLAGFVIALASRFVTVGAARLRRVGGVSLVILVAIPAVILGWLSTVTAVVWWGLGLGIVGAVFVALGPYRSTDGAERREPGRSASIT